MSSASSDQNEKGVSLLGAISIGIGGMVGGGIFAVLGTAVLLAQGGTPAAFLIAGVIALLTSYSYAKLSVKYQSAGGTVVFIDRAFGIDLFTGTLNLILWLSYLVTIALYAAAFGSYGMTFFPHDSSPILKHVIVSVGIVVPAVINIFNAGLISKTETYVVIGKLILLAIIIVAGFPHVDTKPFALSDWPGPVSLVIGGMVIFVAYEGFELISNSSEEMQNPDRNLPIAFYSSVIFVIILYILISIVVVGSVPADQIQSSQDYALAVAAKPSLGNFGFILVSVSALMATFSAINATIYGNARLGYMLAKDGELPAILEKRRKNLPIDGVIFTAGLSLLLANMVDLKEIAIIGSVGFLTIFGFVNLSCMKLAPKLNANRVIPILGALICFVSLIILIRDTFEKSHHTMYIIAGLFASSFLFELIYPRITKRPCNYGCDHEPATE